MKGLSNTSISDEEHQRHGRVVGRRIWSLEKGGGKGGTLMNIGLRALG